jgi:hypothetical protein
MHGQFCPGKFGSTAPASHEINSRNGWMKPMLWPNRSPKKMTEAIPRDLLQAKAAEVSDLVGLAVPRVGGEATGKPLARKQFHQPGFPPGFF